MAKTLNHYSQQIRSLAPDAVALDRAKALGDILIDAKGAVKAAGKLWTEWLQSDCDLTSRTAGRFMTIAKRWNDQAFTDARTANPALAIREADKVLAANSTRKRSVQPAKEKAFITKIFERSSSAQDTVFYCPHPGCVVHIKSLRDWSMQGLKLHCSGCGLSKHEPTEMVCNCVDGDTRRPDFILHLGDLSSNKALPAVRELARSIHKVFDHQKTGERMTASWFEISAAGHTLTIKDAQVPDVHPPVMLSLDDAFDPCVAWVGSALTGEAIKATPDGIIETDELRSTKECEATYELLKQALGWA